MHLRLVVIEPDSAPGEINLELPATIGRGSEATAKLDHALVSRLHCELAEHEGRVMVRDLGSRNGTFVAGQRVETALLPSGELLTIGPFTFRAVYRDAAAPPPPDGATIDETAWAVSTLAKDETTQARSKPEPKPGQSAAGTDDLDDFLNRA